MRALLWLLVSSVVFNVSAVYSQDNGTNSQEKNICRPWLGDLCLLKTKLPVASLSIPPLLKKQPQAFYLRDAKPSVNLAAQKNMNRFLQTGGPASLSNRKHNTDPSLDRVPSFLIEYSKQGIPSHRTDFTTKFSVFGRQGNNNLSLNSNGSNLKEYNSLGFSAAMQWQSKNGFAIGMDAALEDQYQIDTFEDRVSPVHLRLTPSYNFMLMKGLPAKIYSSINIIDDTRNWAQNSGLSQSYETLDLGLVLAPSDNVSLQLVLDNIADKNNPNTGNQQRVIPSTLVGQQGRSATISVGLSF